MARFALFLLAASLAAATAPSNRSATFQRWPFCDGVLERGRRSDAAADAVQRLRLGAADLVRCLDAAADVDRPVHLVFFGDSRIRQQFYNFLQLVPDADLEWRGFGRDPWGVHHDVRAASRLLDLNVTFRWQPLADAKFRRQILRWSSLPVHRLPHWMLIGISTWHMSHGQDDYEEELLRLAPLLRRLAFKVKVVWWSQHPVIERYSDDGINGCPIDEDKLRHHNMIASRILRFDGIVHWDSGRFSAEEYVRSCALKERHDLFRYRDCNDAIHTGRSVVDIGSQILLQHLCLRFLFNDGPQLGCH